MFVHSPFCYIVNRSSVSATGPSSHTLILCKPATRDLDHRRRWQSIMQSWGVETILGAIAETLLMVPTLPFLSAVHHGLISELTPHSYRWNIRYHINRSRFPPKKLVTWYHTSAENTIPGRLPRPMSWNRPNPYKWSPTLIRLPCDLDLGRRRLLRVTSRGNSSP